jgi:hypothetical protein
MKRSTYLVVGVGGAIVAVALAVVALWPSGGAEASAVTVHDAGELVGTFPPQQALDHVSQSVGFEVRGLRKVPAGFEFTGARADPVRPGIENPQKFAILLYTTSADDRAERSSIEVQQTVRFSVDPRWSPIDLGVTGAESYFTESGAGAHIYAVLGGDMGFLVIMMGPDTPARDDAIAAIRTLVD